AGHAAELLSVAGVARTSPLTLHQRADVVANSGAPIRSAPSTTLANRSRLCSWSATTFSSIRRWGTRRCGRGPVGGAGATRTPRRVETVGLVRHPGEVARGATRVRGATHG